VEFPELCAIPDADRHGDRRRYAAVNSAIDELIPAKYRGRIDLIVNGSFWVGAAAGAAVTPLLLDQRLFAVNVGWRLGFGIGGVLGLSILLLRRFVPESPRWLVTHCRAEEAEQTVRGIEKDVTASSGCQLSPAEGSLVVHPRKSFGLGIIFASMLGKNRTRSILALVLMVAQSFLYNSVFFSYGIILSHFYRVPENRVGFYLLPLALGNFCGPLLLGTWFDTIGRRKMIGGTFAISGVLLLLTAALFGAGLLSEVTQTAAWLVIFFFASAAASSAYLTASEIFPLETRALAIACFYALGTAIGGGLSRLADRIRFKLAGKLRLCAGGAAASGRGGHGMEIRQRRRRQIPGAHCQPTFQRRPVQRKINSTRSIAPTSRHDSDVGAKSPQRCDGR
jgi:MFS family permease